jgi:hypothetical protein
MLVVAAAVVLPQMMVVLLVVPVQKTLELLDPQLEIHSQELLEQLHQRDGDILVVQVVTTAVAQVVEVQVVLVELAHLLIMKVVSEVLVFNFQQHLEILLKLSEHLDQQVLLHQMDMINLVSIGLLVEVLVEQIPLQQLLVLLEDLVVEVLVVMMHYHH